MRTSRLIAGAVAVAALGAAVASQLPRRHGAFFPQFRRQLRGHLWAGVSFGLRDDPGAAVAAAPPPMAKPAVLPAVAAYRSAIASGKQHPGALAFHADTDLFCEQNKQAVEQQARKEGLTVAEVKELTFFGFAALRASQRSKVEDVLGHPLSDEQAQKLEQIVQRENEQFTTTMRRQVDEGVGEDRRWETIRSFEQQLDDDYGSELQISADQFDHLLAPDAAELAGAMAVALPPGVQEPPEPSLQSSGPPRALTAAAPPEAGGPPAPSRSTSGTPPSPSTSGTPAPPPGGPGR